MLILRATQKILRTLPCAIEDSASSTNALGDWYVNRVMIDRKPLLLLVSSTSLLPMVIGAKDVKSLPGRFPGLIEARLRRIGVPAAIAAAETQESVVIGIGRTLDRSVVGQMVDFAKAMRVYVPEGAWDERCLPAVEERLAETPCRASKPQSEVVFPRAKAVELLHNRWLCPRTERL